MRVEPLKKTYEKVCVLDFKGMDFQKGKIYAIIGANGSGKSTFGKVLAGIVLADGKKPVLVEDVAVGYMPQKSFPFHLSLEKNVTIACKIDEGVEAKVDYYIKELELEGLRRKKANRLSGGETARMALARAMMSDYDMLILDEPTAAMDVKSTLTSERLIGEYRDKTGSCVVLVTHSIKQALRVSDYTLFFKDGVLWEFGESSALINNPEREETRQFIEFYGV